MAPTSAPGALFKGRFSVGVGFRVEGLRFGFRVLGLGFRVWGLGLRVCVPGLMVFWDLGTLGSVLRLTCGRFRVSVNDRCYKGALHKT